MAVIPSASTVDEGSPITLDVTFDDPGTQDTHTYQIDWGDGNVTSGARGRGTHFSGRRTLRRQRRLHGDGDGDRRRRRRRHGQTAITVNNVAPTLTVVGNQTINEGSLLDRWTNIGTFTDPGLQQPAQHAGPRHGGEVRRRSPTRSTGATARRPSVGAATVDALGSVGMPTAGSFDGMHTYADNGVYTVTVTVLDDDGGQRSADVHGDGAQRRPDAATATCRRQTVNEGSRFTLADLGVRFTGSRVQQPAQHADPANGGETEETFTPATIDWGDGTTPTALDVATPRDRMAPARFTTADFVHAPHTYADNGTYTVTIMVQDDDGAVMAQTLTIEVNNVAPTLTDADRTVIVRSTRAQEMDILDLGTFSDPGFDNP